MESTSVMNRSVELPQVLAGSYLGMFLLGWATTIYGPILPYMAAETQQTPATLGILVVLHSVGFLLSTTTANRLARRLEMRRAMATSACLVALGAAGLIALPYPQSLGSALLLGFGVGTFETLLNRLVELLADEAPAAELNRLHAMWGLGALTMPLIVAGSVWLGFSWRAAGMLLVALALIGAVIIRRWHEFEIPHATETHWRGLPWRSILLFVVMFVVYVGAEVGVSEWATTFFAKLGQGPFVGALATSLFFVTFTFGRLALAGTTERLGYAQTVRLAMAFGGLSLLLLLYEPVAIVGFALAGIAFSVVFPTMVAWGARRHPSIRAQMVSLSIASAGAGGMTIPYGIGWGVEIVGTWSLPLMLVATALAVSVVAAFEPNAR